MANIGEWLFGSGRQPGVLGTGQYQVQGPDLPTSIAPPPSLAQAGQERETYLGELGGRTAPVLATGPQEEMRHAQRRALGLTEQAALGLAPSPAQLLLARGLGQVQRQQLGLAAGARGLGGAAALRAGFERGALAGQEAAGQSAVLRAQEMAQARGELAGVAGAARAQDIGLAQAQAEIDQRAQQAVDQVRMSLIAQGYDAAQAEMLARQRWEEFRGQAALDVERLRQAAYEQARAGNVQAAQMLLSGIGRGAAAIATGGGSELAQAGGTAVSAVAGRQSPVGWGA